jgi:pimeloyl-ACP methyl ester carboxylesterase
MQEQFIDVLGIRTRYAKAGHGDPVIAVPGFPFSWKVYYNVLPILSKRYTMYCIDLPGFSGGTAPAKERHTIDFYMRFLEAFIKEMGLHKVHLIGVSMGGLICMKYAAKHPENVKKIVVNSAPYSGLLQYDKDFKSSRKRKVWGYFMTNFPHTYLRLFKSRIWLNYYMHIKYPEVKAVLSKEVMMEVYNEIANMKDEPIIEIAEDFLMSDYSDDLRKVRTETLIVAGGADKVVPAENCRHLAEDILPNAGFKIVDGASHALAICRYRELSRHILEFFDESKKMEAHHARRRLTTATTLAVASR